MSTGRVIWRIITGVYTVWCRHAVLEYDSITATPPYSIGATSNVTVNSWLSKVTFYCTAPGGDVDDYKLAPSTHLPQHVVNFT
eukprot:5881616-Pleurochrysis_carterae.AAC.1